MWKRFEDIKRRILEKLKMEENGIEISHLAQWIASDIFNDLQNAPYEKLYEILEDVESAIFKLADNGYIGIYDEPEFLEDRITVKKIVKVYNLNMAKEIFIAPPIERRPTREEKIKIYLEAYKWLTGEDWPYPVETDEDIRKISRTIIEIEWDMKRRGEWPPKHHANKRKRKGKKSK